MKRIGGFWDWWLQRTTSRLSWNSISILVVVAFVGPSYIFSNDFCTQTPLTKNDEAQRDVINVDNGVAIMVLSSREAFDVRSTIRETWARGHTGLFFIVGDKSCQTPPAYRKPYSCENNGTAVTLEQQNIYNKTMTDEDASLIAERKEHPELIIVPMVDSYRALPHKLKLGYSWVLEHTDAKWVLKVDEDTVVRIPNLVELLSNYNSSELVVLGRVRRNVGVPKSGKWADPHYRHPTYPPFANGAEGHAVSRGVAEAVVSHNGFEYQGEDVSMGIWLDEVKMPVQFVNVYPRHFALAPGDCSNPKASTIGHDIKPAAMRKCFGTA